MQFALSGTNVSCQFDIPEDLWVCNFDRNQIAQVLDNLIINSQQSMPQGGTIELKARNIKLANRKSSLLAEGNYVKISIKDYGPGIQKEHIIKIFDPFFTTKTMGHGLGLATCHSIVSQHNGCIEVESESGTGSTFHIYLPGLVDIIPDSIEKKDLFHRGQGTFVVMDDEEIIRQVICDMLNSFGYRAVGKENGKDAVDFYISETNNNNKISGMIFDLTIPGGMGGRAAVERIRTLDTEIPVFVVSGFSEDPVMKDPRVFGFTASLSKPFKKSDLMDMLNRWMIP